MQLSIPDNYNLNYLIQDIITLVSIYIYQRFMPKTNNKRFPRVNGAIASKAQLRLARNLGISRKYVNFRIGPYFADMVYPRKKIVIEYNGRYWHKDKRAEDTKRANHLVNRGWKVLIITTNKVPPNHLVRNWLEELTVEKPVKRVSY